MQLGQEKIQSMQSYMDALGKFQPGDATQVKLKRDGKEMTLPIEFMAKWYEQVVELRYLLWFPVQFIANRIDPAIDTT